MPYSDPIVKRQKQAEYRERNRARLAEAERLRQAKLKEANPEAYSALIRARSKKWRMDNLEASRAASRVYANKSYQKRKDSPEFKAAAIVRANAWAVANPERKKATQRSYRRAREAVDTCFKLGRSLRRRLYMAVKGDAKGGEAIRQLGCSIPELRAYLEGRFSPGMAWENWGRHGWHIDHIRPMASFDLTDPRQLAMACHFTNLQPLWASENIRKGALYTEAMEFKR